MDKLQIMISYSNYAVLVFMHFLLVCIFIIFAALLVAIVTRILDWRAKRYLRGLDQSTPAEVVIILGRSDWEKLWAWAKPNFLKKDIEALVNLLRAERKKFSFYPNASFNDVEKIMKDKNIKEVYFVGHGDSHLFKLIYPDVILYYCEFIDSIKYGKEFVHQVHCGSKYGKRLIDYVVPEENRSKCFFFDKTINDDDIVKELERRKKDTINANK